MSERTIVIDDITIELTRKRIKRLNLRVRSPDGRVTISAPRSVSLHAVRSFVEERVDWIRRHRERIQKEERPSPAQYVDGECHNVWGIPHLLTVIERPGQQGASVDSGRITLRVRPGSDVSERALVMHAWHKRLLNEALPAVIEKWQQRLNVRANRYALRRMKTRWGSCNPRSKHIRLNTELATKPMHLLEYVLVHEMVHLIVPNHGPRFVAMMNQHYPAWRQVRKELNDRVGNRS